ncbi:MAG: hypothetical protein AABZ47_03920 [Planctomycetota bacterium]
MTKTISWSLSLLVISHTIGCATRDPIFVWQDRVTQYIAVHGHGDPGVLRETVDMKARSSPRPSLLTFGELDIAGPGLPPFIKTWDAQGVLVGLHKIEKERWFFFLVGTLKRTPRSQAGIDDIRLVVFKSREDKLDWLVAPPNPEALTLYQATHLTECLGRGAIFPGSADSFEFFVSGATVTAKEKSSGAVWQLDTSLGKWNDARPIRR